MSDTITQKGYWDEVTDIAKACVNEARESKRELSEVIWETCDGHQWVIYTNYHHQVLQHTSQDPADRFTDIGCDFSQGWDRVVMQAAFLALEGDVSEKAQELWDEAEEAEEDLE